MTTPVSRSSTGTPHGRWGAPRHWPLAGKLAAVSVVPLVLAGVLGGLRVLDQVGAVTEAGAAVRLLEQRAEVASAADALRRERHDLVLLVSGSRPGDREVVEQRLTATDGTLAGVADLLDGAAGVPEPPDAAFARVATGLASLPGLRSGTVAGLPSRPEQRADAYSELIRALDALDAALLRRVTAPGVPALAPALAATSAVDEQLALQHTIVGTSLRSGSLTAGQLDALEALDRRLSDATDDYGATLTPAQLPVFGGVLDGEAAAEREALATEVRRAYPGARPAVTEAEWDAAHSGTVAAAALAADRISADLTDRAAAELDRARTTAWAGAALVAVGILLAGALVALVGRGLLDSVRRLRASTHRVATRDLPAAVERLRDGEPDDVVVEPVPLDLDDELGDLARTFDDVHGQAVRLAVREAALRRTLAAAVLDAAHHHRTLVEQQLRLIEGMEDLERDPGRSPSLLRLRHLAARVRRHSENLLVVHGAGADRRAPRPVAVGDVIRTAVEEVDHHARVRVRSSPPVAVAVHAVRDVVHLLAELVDNATRFSPPGTGVAVTAAAQADGSVTIHVADQGLGLSDAERAEADHRLRTAADADLPPVRRLGLHVVARLGRRHGVRVRLLDGAPFGTRGVVAAVVLPSPLVGPADPPPAARSATGARAVEGASR